MELEKSQLVKVACEKSYLENLELDRSWSERLRREPLEERDLR